MASAIAFALDMAASNLTRAAVADLARSKASRALARLLAAFLASIAVPPKKAVCHYRHAGEAYRDHGRAEVELEHNPLKLADCQRVIRCHLRVPCVPRLDARG